MQFIFQEHDIAVSLEAHTEEDRTAAFPKLDVNLAACV